MFTRYQIDITRQVAGCGPKLKALVKAEIKATESVPDPMQQFVVDPNSLSSPLKTSDVSFGYATNGAVTSFNATAEDHTAQVVSNVVATAFKAVTIFGVAGAAPGAPSEACSKEVLDAREQIKKQGPVVEAATTVVASLTQDLKALATKATAVGGNVDKATKEAMSKKYDALAAATEDQKSKSDVLDKAMKVVTDVQTVRFPKDGDTGVDVYPLADAVFVRWGRLDSNPNSRADFSVTIALDTINGIGRTLSTADVVDPSLGLPYRQPVLGRLTVCSGGPCSKDNAPLLENVGPVLQMGYVYYLPCQSRPFSSVGCTFTMTDAGELKTMGSSQKTATAEGLSGAAKDVVTQAGTLHDTLSGASTAKLQAETAALKAKADYAAAEAALQPDPLKTDKDQTATLKADTDLLNAKLAQIQADAALADAMAKAGKTP